MKVIDPGHVYDMWQLGSDEPQRITFVKRSGGAVQYEDEHPGVQVQEVLRVLIDRSEYLNDIISCTETQDAIWHLRMALFMYEVRAYRRKQEGLNRQKPEHDDSVSPKPWRENPFPDVPFNEEEIEKDPIGEDGHIQYSSIEDYYSINKDPWPDYTVHSMKRGNDTLLYNWRTETWDIKSTEEIKHVNKVANSLMRHGHFDKDSNERKINVST